MNTDEFYMQYGTRETYEEIVKSIFPSPIDLRFAYEPMLKFLSEYFVPGDPEYVNPQYMDAINLLQKLERKMLSEVADELKNSKI